MSDDELSRFDIRLRSLDQGPGGNLCCKGDCGALAEWSVWVHDPTWGPTGGATYVRCHRHALAKFNSAADLARRELQAVSR